MRRVQLITEREVEEDNEAASMAVLPEDCLSKMLSLTSPGDACRASAISNGFKSAADSDTVWERFLPPGYHEIIAKAVSPVVFSSKKQLYFYLSESPILLDRGNLSIMLDKWSGKKCYMLGARGLSIGGQDEQWWEWGPIPESRFPEVVMLRAICWLEIRGKIATVMLSQKTTYAAFLVFQIAEDSMELDVPGKTMINFAGKGNETSNVYLQQPGAPHGDVPMQENDRFPHKRKDGWMEIQLGEFYCDEEDDGEVEMVFMEVWHGHWKRGLVVEGIELRPN